MEKKEIKISLWTFYILAAAIIILIAVIAIGWLTVVKNKNNDMPNSIIENNKENQNLIGNVQNNMTNQTTVSTQKEPTKININSSLVQQILKRIEWTQRRFCIRKYISYRRIY